MFIPRWYLCPTHIKKRVEKIKTRKCKKIRSGLIANRKRIYAEKGKLLKRIDTLRNVGSRISILINLIDYETGKAKAKNCPARKNDAWSGFRCLAWKSKHTRLPEAAAYRQYCSRCTLSHSQAETRMVLHKLKGKRHQYDNV